MEEYDEVLDFWFDPDNVPYHFENNKAFDKKLKDNFYHTWEKASKGLLLKWRGSIHGRLAEIIVLDQFSRNLFRGNEKAYLQDKMALVLAQEAVTHKEFEKLTDDEMQFVLMPFMHSESIEIHEWAKPYFDKYGNEGTNHFEEKHVNMLKEFGRYPYRNEVLGRISTEKENSGYAKEW